MFGETNGILICGGFSKRMGEFKPLMQYEGLPFALNILFKMSRVCNKLIVVTGHQGGLIKEKLNELLNDKETLANESDIELNSVMIDHLKNKLEFVENTLYEDGMFTSFQAGLRTVSDSEWVLYHFVDQPTLPRSFYDEFISLTYNDVDWIQPKYEGVKGHPILINRSLFNQILESDKKTNLREVIRDFVVMKRYYESPFPQALDDIDTISDYNRIMKIDLEVESN
ncbi:MAG: NTP transferase domain-containing protein [Melioribacteraceae bacterium]|nr:NTP transferase domain-containing protein [Melioribacteraceae bacterium]